MPDVSSIQGRYERLKSKRDHYLTRARRSAKMTIPAITPPEGFTGAEALYTPWQGVGARGLRNLSAKIVMAIMPAGAPMFRKVPSPDVVLELKEAGQDEQLEEAESQLSAREKALTSEIERSGDRTMLGEAAMRLLNDGNICIDQTKNESRMVPLANYVVVRDGRGFVTEAILEETASAETLRAEGYDIPHGSHKEKTEPREMGEGDQDEATLFTDIIWNGKMYEVVQEVRGVPVGEPGTYKADDLPFLFLRFTRVDGESYGRGFVEELIGDLSTLETLSQAITEAAMGASKVIFLVRPNGSTRIQALNEAPNMSFVAGSADDVQALRLDKAADLRVAQEVAATIEQRLSEQFLLHSSVRRDAERVTAEEIRLLANELNDGLSDIYSLLALEFQKPYIRRKEALAVKSGVLRRLPEGTTDSVIVTGLEALGRNRDLQLLDMFVERAVGLVGPELFSKVVDVQVLIKRIATALSFDDDGIYRDPSKVQNEEIQGRVLDTLQQTAPDIVKGSLNAQSA